jgi:hypothetical protein
VRRSHVLAMPGLRAHLVTSGLCLNGYDLTFSFVGYFQNKSLKADKL